MFQDDLYVHAPTVACSLLRQAASVIEAASRVLPEETIFFPTREAGESQPATLEGEVPLEKLFNLIRYLADMLEA